MKPQSWRDLIPACRSYYAKHAAGGSLHIVLDDGNLCDHNVDFCIKFAQKEGDRQGEALARLIRSASYTQRKKLYDNYNEYAYGSPGGTIVDMMRALGGPYVEDFKDPEP